MIWATVSSWSCFCWPYRASPPLAAKNIINMIWCWPSGDVHVQSLLLCWKTVFAMTSVFSCQNSISLYPASFCTPRPNWPVIPGVSWLPTFAFQPPIMKRTSFLGVSSRNPCRFKKKKPETELTYNPAILFLGTYLQKTIIWKHTPQCS